MLTNTLFLTKTNVFTRLQPKTHTEFFTKQANTHTHTHKKKKYKKQKHKLKKTKQHTKSLKHIDVDGNGESSKSNDENATHTQFELFFEGVFNSLANRIPERTIEIFAFSTNLTQFTEFFLEKFEHFCVKSINLRKV